MIAEAAKPPQTDYSYLKPKTRPATKMGQQGAYKQAVQMQRVLFSSVLAEETTPAMRAQCARAWAELEERKRILRMKPKPKDLDVSDLHRAKRQVKPAADPFTLPDQSKAA